MKNHLLTFRRLAAGPAVALLFLGSVISGQALAQFIPPPNTIGLTIEGCNNGGNTPITPSGTLPNADGRFVCQDPAPLGGNDNPYTTGNLGKDWSELDLVPHRLTVTNSGAATTYNVQVAADYENNDTLGYDVITQPEIIPSGQLNGFSAAGCIVASTSDATVPDVTGGAGQSIYRTLTITHPANSTCVVDFALRLAVGASGFPGASLQSYKFESGDFSTGKATISLPVNEIEPQTLAKEMTATQNTDFAWNVTKGPNPATLNFGDTCDVNNDRAEQVAIQVNWEILPGVDGMVMVVTNISATNPSSRSIRVDVSDEIFGNIGNDVESLDVFDCDAVDVPANTTQLVCTHIFDAPADVTDLSDTATASYIDVVTDIPVPGQTTAEASASIQAGTDTNTTAMISDSESISGTGLSFTVDSTSGAAVTCNPTVPTGFTTGPVVCATGDQTGAGSVTFNKTVYLDEPRITSGTLSDTATLTGSDSFTAEASANVDISSNALVKLTIRKVLVDDILQGDDEACFDFELADTDNDTPNISQQICFDANDPTVKEVTIGGLPPDTYTVTETPAVGWAVTPPGDTQQQVDLNLPICENTVTFNNEFAPQEFAHAQVKKVSDPLGFEVGWEFDLQRCPDLDPANCEEGDYETVSSLTTTGADFEFFLNDTETALLNLEEGTYRIGEVTQAGWDTPVAANCNDFVVDYPASVGATFSCTYTNTKLGTIIIKKVTDPIGGTGFGFTDNIEEPNVFALDDGGTKTFLNVSAGTYTVTEDDPTPDFDLTTLTCTDSDGTGTASTWDVATLTASIELDPGETVECTFTNTQRAMVELTKLVNGATPTQDWKFKLTGPEVNVMVILGSQNNQTTFNDAKLIIDEKYTLCEVGLPASWTANWTLNEVTVIPVPDANNNSIQCHTFTATPAGTTFSFEVDNIPPPGGEPRTIGYWANWTTCDGRGRQEQTAAKNGGPEEGFFLLDDVLPQTLGDFVVSECLDGVNILKKSRLDGTKRAKDAAYSLAAQLLAAKANTSGVVNAGCRPGDLDATIEAADALLVEVGFDGTGSYLPPRRSKSDLDPLPKVKDYRALRDSALDLAGELDKYNNGEYCF